MRNHANRRPAVLALVAALLAGVTGSAAAAGPLRVTYVGNEGFLVRSADRAVLIDALYREGVPGYVVLPEERRRKLESAAPPFDGVDLVLASHFHPDHFDAGAVAAHLRASTGTRFVSTPQAVDRLRSLSGFDSIRDRVRSVFPEEGERVRVEREGVVLRVLNITHGPGRPVQNLGLLIELGGHTILHIGDSEARASDLRRNRLAEEKIDLAFLPYWYLTGDPERTQAVQAIAPRRIVAMHVPPPGDPRGYLRPEGGFGKLAGDIERRHPNAVVFRREMESRDLP